MQAGGSNIVKMAAPDLRAEDIERVAEVLRSGMFVQGPWVGRLEQDSARVTGFREVVAVSSGTAALHLALLACGIGPGDEVIVPAFSFMATANAVVLVGARPVFVDINPRTFNLNVEQLPAVVGSRTRAILPVHEFGLLCELGRVRELADDGGLDLIEDAACAIGSGSNSVGSGQRGRLATYSLHPRKVVTSGEGGLIATDDPAMASLLRSLRNHGLEVAPNGERVFVRVGLNYRLSDFQAAIAWGQLTRLDQMLARRRRVAAALLEGIDHPRVKLPTIPAGAEPNWQTFHLVLDQALPRAEAVAHLAARGVQSGPGAQCLPAEPSMSPFVDGEVRNRWPAAWQASRQGLAIPCHEAMLDDQVGRVVEAVNSLPS